ncbi:MAG TPA: hypothetical protein VH301_17325, partial [Usitatibacter sp.]|nr:hypothetical protein [Usitatibacter sp.]
LLDAPVALARAAGGSDAAMPLQVFGVVDLVLFAALAAAVAIALRANPVASVVHGLLVMLLIADPVATLWFNTLNPEPAALLGAYAAVASLGVILLRGDDVRAFWWILGAGLAVLGLSRGQFGYLPLLAALVVFPALAWRSRRRAIAIVVVGVAIALAQWPMSAMRPAAVGSVERTNAYLGLIVASSPNALETLEHLGLPSRCEHMSGASWASRRGESLESMCPEVTRLSPFAFTSLVLTEPLTLLRAASRVLPAAQAIVPGYLAISSQGPVVSVADLPPRAMSFVALLSYVPSLIFATAVMALLVAFPAGFAWLVWTVRREPRMSALPAVFLLLVAIGGYTLASTAFGEGMAGAELHNWLGALATLAAVMLIPLATWQLTSDQLRARIAVAVVFGVALLAAGWLLWTRAQPLAIGGTDKLEVRAGMLDVTGWALDPWGVHRVYASVGGGPVTEGTLGIERTDLARTYPGYPQAMTAGYEIAIPANAWRENEELRVYVEGRSGSITEIDRRLIRPRGPSGSSS